MLELWRYRELLPILNDDNHAVTLREGNTPLYDMPRCADIAGVDRADYCLSKAALSMMSKLYAVRLASAGIHVFEVRPGIIRTAMTEPATREWSSPSEWPIAEWEVPLLRWGVPEDVGTAVATLADGRLPFATGDIVNIGGGLHLHRV